MEGWSWDKLQLATWGMPPVDRGFNKSEVEFKERFEIMFVDNLLGHRDPANPAAGCVVGSPEVCHNQSTTPRCNTLDECRKYKSSIAAPLMAAKRSKGQKVLGYRGIVIAWWNFVVRRAHLAPGSPPWGRGHTHHRLCRTPPPPPLGWSVFLIAAEGCQSIHP